jgi:hypothetical protein
MEAGLVPDVLFEERSAKRDHAVSHFHINSTCNWTVWNVFSINWLYLNWGRRNMSSACWGLEVSRLLPSCLLLYSLLAPFSVYQTAQSACYQCRSWGCTITKILVNRIGRQPEGKLGKCARGNVIGSMWISLHGLLILCLKLFQLQLFNMELECSFVAAVWMSKLLT